MAAGLEQQPAGGSDVRLSLDDDPKGDKDVGGRI
jgi:hypothetical protein